MPSLQLLLAGDVMTGRGIDQVMADPLPPGLHEPWVRDARDYVGLAERANGPIPAPVAPGYVWGEALAEAARLAPDLRIVNLETAVTRASTPWPGKGIHYRMSPAHVDCLQAAGLDVCVLANNHVLDWGRDGLAQTLQTLHAAGLRTAGAGADLGQAQAPAVTAAGGARLLVFAWATPDSGVPEGWAAAADRPGIALLPGLDEEAAQRVAATVRASRRGGDRVLVSLHWGGNWVDEVPQAQRRFARRLIDLGVADLVHGHSSHHPLPMEVHRGHLVLHGCGDLLNDYEGITPHARHRADLPCLYAATLDGADGRLQRLEVVPLQLRRFRLGRPDAEAAEALRRSLDHGCRELGARLEAGAGGRWQLRWR